MLIPTIDDGLERLLRAALPLPEDTGDVSFDPPSGTWSAQVNRLTVNLFLYQVSRSAQQPRASANRVGERGTERRFPLPVVQLGYLVSAWAGSPRDEHSLLGDVLTCFLVNQTLPPEHLVRPPASPVQLAVVGDDPGRTRELWSSLGGQVKASFTLTAQVAADAYQWELAPPLVTSVEPVTTRLGARP